MRNIIILNSDPDERSKIVKKYNQQNNYITIDTSNAFDLYNDNSDKVWIWFMKNKELDQKIFKPFVKRNRDKCIIINGNKIYSIVGTMGSGKTTYINNQDDDMFIKLPEPVDKFEDYLNSVYNNLTPNNLRILQEKIRSSTYEQIDNVLYNYYGNKSLLIESDIELKDIIFNYAHNIINENTMIQQFYTYLYTVNITGCYNFIHINEDSYTIMERIKQRGRPSELNIKKEFIDRLNYAHKIFYNISKSL